ncbi:uncharacterized protein cubi_02652 [Cryptosporidium ubiquitum]|uniref:Transcription elongation factor SPT6 n=1 Tax=Cryptosporidium ubiquitum TaxID=857276 RepID=A0A1J4MGV8_9CRYT|nr:uncharacterized protein cubi_02652 [Cryptosporidium ubiquitum]OII73440.1 hypothetical protein cubi_02652 [Cryptosporidium ubiquitum]
MEQESRNSHEGGLDTNEATNETFESLKESGPQDVDVFDTNEVDRETFIENKDNLVGSIGRNEFEDTQNNPTKILSSSVKLADNSRAQRPKKKKRRQQGSVTGGGSLQALLHAGTSDDHFSQSDSSAVSEESRSEKRTRKRKSFGSKSQKKNREKYRMYIHDEAEEDEDGEENTREGSHERPSRRKRDSRSSSEDDEEEDDEEGYDELKDFIADEVEEDGIDDSLVYRGPHILSQSAVQGEKNLLAPNERSDMDHESSEDDDDDEILRGGLEEDDLALIEENTGIRLNKDSQKHRLKKVSETLDSQKTLVGKNIGDLEDLLFNNGDDGVYQEEDPLHRPRDLDPAPGIDSEDSQDSDDWMVDDLDERGLRGDEFNIIQSVFGDYDTVMDILMNKVSKVKDITESSIIDSETVNNPKFTKTSEEFETEKTIVGGDHEIDMVDDIDEELFGESPEKEEGEVENIQDRMKKTTLQTLHSISEPAELEGQFLTDFDGEVKYVDIPERLYLLYGTRWKSLKERKIGKEELQQEAIWISRKFLQTYPELFKEELLRRSHNLEFKTSFPYVSNGGVLQLVSNAVFSVLDWLLNERLDIPYISLHKMHLIQPPLNDFLLGKIVFLDSIYYKLKLSIESFQQKLLAVREKKSVSDIFRLTESRELPEDHIIQAFLSVSGLQETLKSSYYFDSSRDIDNIRLYFMYHIDTPRFRQIEEITIGDPSNTSKGTEIGQNSQRNLNRKHRKNYMIEFFEYIEVNELFNVWSPYIVSPYVLSLYLKSFTSPQFHCSTPTGGIPGLPNTFSLLPPGGPVLENSKTALYKWLDKLVRQDNPMFSTSEKVLESVIMYEARRLASFPAIRAKTFEYFLSNACITTVTTIKGEKTLSPNGVFWLAKRLFRKPVNTLLPGTYLPLNDDTGSDSQNNNSNMLFDGCLCSEVLELERRGLIELIVHPLCIDDPAPWRGSDGEAKIKERFLHEVGLLDSGIESNMSNSLQKGSLPTPILNRFDQEFRMYVNSDNIDNRIVRNILDELKYGYVSISGSIWSKLVQIPILHRLIEKELFPSFRTEVINYLKMRSQEYIAELCSLNLQKRLRVLPPKHPERDESVAEGQRTKSGENNKGDRSKEDNQYDSEEDDFDNYSGNNIDSDDDNFLSKRSKNSKWRGTSGDDFNIIREEYNTNWGLNVISCVVEKAQNGFKVCVVSLDIFGELRDFLVLDHLLGNVSFRNSKYNDKNNERDALGSLESQRFDEDMENLTRFAKMYYPHYVCVGISDRKSLELAGLWNNILKKVKKKDQKFTPGFLFVSMDVSRALVRRSVTDQRTSGAQKPKGLQSEYPMYVNLAVSVGRLVQNPLAEQLQLWEDSGNEIESELSTNTLGLDNDIVLGSSSSSTGAKDWFNPITCLRLHRLQDVVDPKMLQFHLLLAIRSVVGNLGVQINRMKGHSHLQSPLKFVSGLGPRKAKSLVSYLDSHPGPISTRSQLKQDDHYSETKQRKGAGNNDFYEYDFREGEENQAGCLTKNVYLNAQVFLRVDEDSYNEKEYNKNLNIFDISRLSDEEDKELVLTILGNIRDQVSEETVSGGRQKSKEKDETLLWTWISKRSSKLETLDLEAYAKLMYENQDRPRLLPYLNRMLRELKKPYDCSFVSREFRGVEKSRQLRESLEISREDLFIGCEITCRITAVLSNARGPSRCPISLWFDQYNMKVILEDFESLWVELLDEFPNLQSASFDSLFKVNTPLQAIVTNIDFSQHCLFVSMSQSKVCNILNYLIDGVWRQQQYRLDMIDKHRHESSSVGSQSQGGQVNSNLDTSSISMANMAIQEYRKNDFNLLQDDLSALIWTDIRHFAFILFKKNLNVLSTSSGLNLSSGLGKNGNGSGDRLWERDGRGDGKYHGTVLRTIHHPNFRSWSHEQIVEHMKVETIPLGEVIIKSSTKYIDKLNMYIKVCENPFMFKVINIDEFDQRLPGELGRRLRIDDSDFNDIDQILIQYVHPLKVHLSSVFTHPKYRSNMEYQNLVTELLVESSNSGNSIVWGITADKQIPCRFHLISVPPNSRVGSSGARIHFEDGIYVNHKGFQLWRKSENTLRKLLNWWKTDGFFKRSKHLEDYKRYKEYMVRQKQGKTSSENDFGSRKFGASHHNTYHHSSGGAGFGNVGGTGHQSQHSGNYSHSRHHAVESFSSQAGGSHSKAGGGAPQYGSHFHSGGFRKSFHGYPPQMEGGSAHHYPPPIPEPYESGFPSNYRYSRR